eukprot:Protomagalhaensia_wolfi_Nauph_80__6230@NODE_939_length_1864_cov_85_928219_g709_i0_p2_GENE_NODE_939_length_1864_cov_85_928219_g709_i0NODE_939_length_1864_cov_85_928219_g709_i0_p2_ORF_typecomplete_len129_score22_32PKI/PF02827_16/0_53PKI/PF02827_16/4_7e02_NODE_939_length_1864_cov_85_928219_g709_i012541640
MREQALKDLNAASPRVVAATLQETANRLSVSDDEGGADIKLDSGQLITTDLYDIEADSLATSASEEELQPISASLQINRSNKRGSTSFADAANTDSNSGEQGGGWFSTWVRSARDWAVTLCRMSPTGH